MTTRRTISSEGEYEYGEEAWPPIKPPVGGGGYEYDKYLYVGGGGYGYDKIAHIEPPDRGGGY
jgi:hypothetical protein